MPHIEEFSFGSITIDGVDYTADVIIYPWAVDDTWWRDEGHVVKLQDLTEALDADPELLVVGTGAHGRVEVRDEVRAELDEREIDLVAAPTDKAVEKYNRLQAERRVVAALHLTC
jgi:hypothetical protein